MSDLSFSSSFSSSFLSSSFGVLDLLLERDFDLDFAGDLDLLLLEAFDVFEEGLELLLGDLVLLLTEAFDVLLEGCFELLGVGDLDLLFPCVSDSSFSLDLERFLEGDPDPLGDLDLLTSSSALEPLLVLDLDLLSEPSSSSSFGDSFSSLLSGDLDLSLDGDPDLLLEGVTDSPRERLEFEREMA